jgi:hypothetical protein
MMIEDEEKKVFFTDPTQACKHQKVEHGGGHCRLPSYGTQRTLTFSTVSETVNRPRLAQCKAQDADTIRSYIDGVYSNAAT